MSLKRWILLIVVLTIGVIVVFSTLRSSPPEVSFAKVGRQDLVSTLITNGQVEPQVSAEIRAESTGRVAAILGRQGEPVLAGAVLLNLDGSETAARIADARATLASAEERLRQLKGGGTPLAMAEIEGTLRATRVQIEQAAREAGVLRKLVEQKAATPEELRRQEEELARLQSRVESLERQRGSLVAPADRAAAESAVGVAKTAVLEAERAATLRSVRSPIGGTLYEFAVRVGAYLNPGDLVGRVGDLEAVRVSVFVDEPELGKLQLGQPVEIRWDAKPGRTWKGEVNQLPTRIQAFGTRQVGEVVCRIANPGNELLPGTNVNVEIETARIQGALVIPKQALRRRLGEDGVWKLESGAIRWQAIDAGVSNLTAAQVNRGLEERDSVVLVYDRELIEGMKVEAVYP